MYIYLNQFFRRGVSLLWATVACIRCTLNALPAKCLGIMLHNKQQVQYTAATVIFSLWPVNTSYSTTSKQPRHDLVCSTMPHCHQVRCVGQEVLGFRAGKRHSGCSSGGLVVFDLLRRWGIHHQQVRTAGSYRGLRCVPVVCACTYVRMCVTYNTHSAFPLMCTYVLM